MLIIPSTLRSIKRSLNYSLHKNDISYDKLFTRGNQIAKISKLKIAAQQFQNFNAEILKRGHELKKQSGPNRL